MSLKSILIAATGLAGVMSAPTTDLSKREVISSNQEGTSGGYFYSNYVQSGSNTLDIGSGSYDVTWSTANEDIVSGLGWGTGSARTVSYTGSVDASGDTRLALYGWTTNPLIEYYVVETYGSYNPGSAGQKMGSFTSDGSNYDVYKTTRTNAPSIVGTATFNQFFSIRTDKRTSGTITFQNHIDAWASFGLELGSNYDYQIMAIEGYQSSGSASVSLN